jgi:hypothetical protein
MTVSRHEIPARDTGHSVTVGWDRVRQTFFAVIEDSSRPTNEKIVGWAGGGLKEIDTVEALAEGLKPYADLTEEMALTLILDQQEGR